MTSASRYAGAVSRLAAYVVDVVLVSGIFSAGAAAVAFLTRVVTGRHLGLDGDRDVAGVALAVWWFLYFSLSWATTGMTPGMALLGVRVVRADGSPAGARHAVLRTLAFPLSVALFGLGFLGILFHTQRRALHDLIASTAVIYLLHQDQATRRRTDLMPHLVRTTPARARDAGRADEQIT
ncbi:MAG TPA: RDD family protein [Acidimicrobiales bacterium]|nr:RDD family protein [Acidimicrobiales bacterium]